MPPHAPGQHRQLDQTQEFCINATSLHNTERPRKIGSRPIFGLHSFCLTKENDVTVTGANDTNRTVRVGATMHS